MISFGKISNIPAAGDRQGPVLPCKGEFVRAAKILSDGMFNANWQIRPLEHKWRFSAYFFYSRYVGDMLAWLHQAIASEKELLHSLLRHSTSSMCWRLYFFKTEVFIEVT